MKQSTTSDAARQTALDNAQEALDLPILPKGYQFRSFEIYLGAQIDEPAYAMHDGRMIALNVPVDPDGSILQMIGDHQPVFVAVDFKTLASRVGDSGLPEFPTDDIESLVNRIVGAE